MGACPDLHVYARNHYCNTGADQDMLDQKWTKGIKAGSSSKYMMYILHWEPTPLIDVQPHRVPQPLSGIHQKIDPESLVCVMFSSRHMLVLCSLFCFALLSTRLILKCYQNKNRNRQAFYVTLILNNLLLLLK